MEPLYEEGSKEDVDGAFFRARLKCELIQGNITEKEVIKQFEARFMEGVSGIDTESPNSALEMNKLLDYYNVAYSIGKLLNDSKKLEKERGYFTEHIVPRLVYIFQSVPYSFMTQDVNFLCAELFVNTEPFLNGVGAKEDFLFKMLICRQPITYIHSLMVSKIAILIAQELLEVNPEQLIGACGIEHVEELLARRAEVLSYIGHCGILHDVGKCGIAEVINQQRRKLSREEFDIIKNHPQKGVALLNKDEAFAPYYDVILGHHKYYDGKGGYPAEFDNTKSPIRGVIDLISIADCVDAATDVFGRNYTAGKTFEELLGELIKGAGTRYNPVIVDCIAASSSLQSKLSSLTADGRSKIYYQAYRTIKKLGSNDISGDWGRTLDDIL
ncbi:MAG: HD domain-containing protein [Lachnospiraceae bacterium]|nr:HD domain-containing protein [Lachnospiraceae bacterium]